MIHQVLLREVFQYNWNEIWFDFGGKEYGFGLDELYVIIGLSYEGDVDTTKFETIENLFMERYLCHKKKISRKETKDTFNSKKWKNDDDAVKLGLFYSIANFLFTKPSGHLIDLLYFDLVGSGTFSSYP